MTALLPAVRWPRSPLCSASTSHVPAAISECFTAVLVLLIPLWGAEISRTVAARLQGCPQTGQCSHSHRWVLSPRLGDTVQSDHATRLHPQHVTVRKRWIFGDLFLQSHYETPPAPIPIPEQNCSYLEAASQQTSLGEYSCSIFPVHRVGNTLSPTQPSKLPAEMWLHVRAAASGKLRSFQDSVKP